MRSFVTGSRARRTVGGEDGDDDERDDGAVTEGASR